MSEFSKKKEMGIEFDDNPLQGVLLDIASPRCVPAYSNGIKTFDDLKQLKINSKDSYDNVKNIFGELRKNISVH